MPAPIYTGHEIDRGSGFRLIRTDGETVDVEARRVVYVLRSDLGDRDRLPRAADQLLIGEPDLESGPDGREWLRLTYAPYRYRDMRDALHRKKVRTWEHDFSPLRRHLSESSAPLAEPGDLNVLLFDLEVDDRKSFEEQLAGKARVLSWSAKWMGAVERVRGSLLKKDTDAAERALLRKLLRRLNDAHMLSAWNLPYDEQVLRNRCEYLGLDYYWDRLVMLDMLGVWRRRFIRGASGAETTSFALADIGANVLGVSKVDLKGVLRAQGLSPPDTGAGTWYAWQYAPEMLLKYNEQDTELLDIAEQRKAFVHLQIVLARLCRCIPNDRSLNATQLADGVFIGLGKRRGVHWPDKPKATEEQKDAWRSRTKDDKAEGALILDVKPGTYEDVHMLDFSGMYPSIMRCGNISMETRVGDEFDGPKSTTPNGAHYRTDFQGLFPYLVERFTKQRAKWKALAKEAKDEQEQVDRINRADVFKVFMNSMYGLTLSKLWSRYYDKDNGEAVTTSAQELLGIVVEEIERSGGYVVMGDTDGGAGCEFDPHKLLPVTAERAKEWAAAHDFRHDEIGIEYETTFDRFAIGCKKRYIGVATYYKGATLDEPKIEVKGYEYIRSDSMRLVRAEQRWLAEEYLLRDGDVNVVLSRLGALRDALVANEHGIDDLVVAKRMNKAPEEYAAKPPHVRIAMEMIAAGAGVQVGEKIPYVVVGKQSYKGEDGKKKQRVGAVHPSKFSGKYDGAYVWNEYVLPPLRRLGEVIWPDAQWDLLKLRRVRRGRSVYVEQMDLPVARKEIVVEELSDDEMEADVLGAPEFTDPPTQRAVCVIASGASKFVVKRLRNAVNRCPGLVPVAIVVDTGASRVPIETEHRCDPDKLRDEVEEMRSVSFVIETL